MRKSITIKKMELLKLYETIHHPMLQQYNRTLTYVLTFIEESIKNDVKALEAAVKPDVKYLEYDEKRFNIIKKYCEVDSTGSPVISGESYQIRPDSVENCKKDIQELEIEYDQVLRKIEQDFKEFQIILNQDVEVVIETINLRYLPNKIGKDLMKELFNIIQKD